ncbi:GntR family transcriptional regulator [Methanolapillus millepedarum]|uniref:HTH-type transcriptional repressor YtrA n=1 Tax=Methanolapillus millepedarum TaxID=3028296 RepID=A0AA96ZVJ6_9EURY|nr:HTH-type transcriptional repressor YtrA [Methanosarcinaceae archaeon Ac7]
MNIIISNTAGVPIYEQIKEQIKSAIFSGELSDGDLLPSIRSLAKDLKISVITTMRAYNDLEQEGFVVNVQGKGCYVKPQNTELLLEQKLREIEENLQEAIDISRQIKISDSELSEMLKLLLEEGDNHDKNSNNSNNSNSNIGNKR